MNSMTKLFLTLVGVCLFAITLSISCRKADLPGPLDLDNPVASVTSTFFNSHRGGSAMENGLINFLMREDSKKHFVEATVNKIGYLGGIKLLK